MGNENEFGTTAQLPHSSLTKIPDKLPSVTDFKPGRSKCYFRYGFFASKQLTCIEDGESYIRTSIIELCVYIVFVVIICIVTFGMTASNGFYYTKLIKEQFMNKEDAMGYSFQNVKTVDDSIFWRWAEGTMIQGLYNSYWKIVPFLNKNSHDKIFYENRLIGVPRLRQLRVIKQPCPNTSYKQLLRVCYPAYHPSLEDKRDWKPIGPSTKYKTAWKYHTEAELDGDPTSTHSSLYSGAGAYIDLATKPSDTFAILSSLKTDLWINRATRAVFLDFTMYNANINMFCVVRMVWEFLPTGGVHTSWDIHTVRLIRYVTNFDTFILVCEIIFCVFTVYYLLQEILELIHLGFFKYVNDFWSWLDLIILAISFYCIGVSIRRHIFVEQKLANMMKDPSTFSNFHPISGLQVTFTSLLALENFLVWIKIFKYVSFNKTMTELSSIFVKCGKYLCGLFILFFVAVIAFAQFGYLVFGSQVEIFSTLYKSICSLLRLIVTDFNLYYKLLQNANRVLGPLFFFTYFFCIFFVLLNMFLAIINESYNEVKAEIQTQTKKIEISDYIKRGFNRLMEKFSCCHKKIPTKKDSETLQIEKNSESPDGEVTYKELRNNLRNANFSDVEVEMFLARYELDQNRALDEDEMQQVLADLEGQRIVLDKSDKAEFQRLSNFNKYSEDPDKGLSLTKEELADMKRQVGAMESTIMSVTGIVDQLHGNIDSFKRKQLTGE